MAYNEITNRTSPNKTLNRNGAKIDKIVLHWWGDPATNPQAENVVNWLCNPASQVSAHFVATGTGRRVWQIVDDKDASWANGNWNANMTSLTIEADPRCRDEDYDVVAELIADLWKHYGKLPVYSHSHFFNTRCAGNWNLIRLVALAEQKLNGIKNDDRPEKIKLAYREILKREADTSGLNHYLNQMNKGWTIEQVRSDLMNSSERKQVEAYEKAKALEIQAKKARELEERRKNEELKAKLAEQAKKAEEEAKKAREEEQKIREERMEEATSELPTFKLDPESARKLDENNNLLKRILEAVTGILNKIKGVFK